MKGKLYRVKGSALIAHMEDKYVKFGELAILLARFNLKNNFGEVKSTDYQYQYIFKGLIESIYKEGFDKTCKELSSPDFYIRTEFEIVDCDVLED